MGPMGPIGSTIPAPSQPLPQSRWGAANDGIHRTVPKSDTGPVAALLGALLRGYHANSPYIYVWATCMELWPFQALRSLSLCTNQALREDKPGSRRDAEGAEKESRSRIF
jgi:hypothetical protein